MSASPNYALGVLISTHNRRERLTACLDALRAQSLDPASFEVIIADDGSSDATAEMLASYDSPFRLRVLALTKRGKPAALNAALEICEAARCLFIDDDVIAAPGLLAAHLSAAEEDPRTLAIGRLIQPEPARSDWFARAHAAAWNQRYSDLAGRRADWADCYGANFSAPLALLRAIGGFDEGLDAVEDIELGYRLCRAGAVPAFLPGAEAIHEDEKPRGKILADIRAYGAFCAAFGERHPETRPRLLGWFRATTPRELWLRRLFICARAPVGLLAAAGRAVPGEGRRRIWFGFLSSYGFWLGARRALRRRRWLETTRGVPVLLYHAFSESGEREVYVCAAHSFARQMRLLALLGYRPIAAGELAANLREYRLPARRSAVVTIDDGYADNFEIAIPILRRHGFTATIYLVSDRLGKSNDWNRDGAAKGRPLLSLEAIRSMQENGFEFGSHTLTHRSLPGAPAGEAKREIEQSRTDLDSILMTPTTTLAYPYGELDQSVLGLVEGAGYVGAYASHVPQAATLGDDPLQIPRIEIRGEDGILGFLRKLWLGGP
ncbi:MAG: glycosyltransferase [Solirubrobacterales bacterium]